MHPVQIWPLLGQELGGWLPSKVGLASSPRFGAGPTSEIDVLLSSGCADAWSPQTSEVGPVVWVLGQLPLPTVV